MISYVAIPEHTFAGEFIKFIYLKLNIELSNEVLIAWVWLIELFKRVTNDIMINNLISKMVIYDSKDAAIAKVQCIKRSWWENKKVISYFLADFLDEIDFLCHIDELNDDESLKEFDHEPLLNSLHIVFAWLDQTIELTQLYIDIDKVLAKDKLTHPHYFTATSYSDSKYFLERFIKLVTRKEVSPVVVNSWLWISDIIDMVSNDSYLEEDAKHVRERRLTSYDKVPINELSPNPQSGLLNMMISSSDSMDNMIEDNFFENQKMLANFQFDDSEGDTIFESSTDDANPLPISKSTPAVSSITPRPRNSKSNLFAILGAPELQEISEISEKWEASSAKKNVEIYSPSSAITPGEIKSFPSKSHSYQVINSPILSPNSSANVITNGKFAKPYRKLYGQIIVSPDSTVGKSANNNIDLNLYSETDPSRTSFATNYIYPAKKVEPSRSSFSNFN